jgi:N-acetylglutamate synthase-like GNAT family acetyltransferase
VTERQVVVRTARPEDEPVVYELAADMATSFAVDRRSFRNSFRSLIEADEAFVLVADVGGQVGGYLLGFTHLTFYANGPVAWVEEIAVQSQLRRQRLGALLMAEFESRATAAGAALVALATRRAASFYDAIGYDASATYFRKTL